jgi:nitroreductase
MEVVECIEGRTSIRAFGPDSIEDSTIGDMLRLANLAPSAGNLQARDFIVVKSAQVKKKLAEAAYGQDFVRSAPIVVVFCANLKRIEHYGERGRSLYCLQDVAASVQNAMLYLHSKGLGSVWVGAFDEERVRAVLEIPSEARPVAILPIGYPSEEGVKRRRLAPEQITHREKW